MIITLISLLLGSCISGTIRPTRLLPSDGSIIHCAGQVNQNLTDMGQYDTSINSFTNYSNYFPAGNKPQTMMVCIKHKLSMFWFKSVYIIKPGLFRIDIGCSSD